MMDRIAENVFLGDAKSAVDAEGIREHKVKRILTVASEPINEKCRVPEAEYKFIFMLDIDDQNIITSGILEQALNFMRETVNSGQAILVHCEYGISRSTTIVTAFLMARYRTAYHDTLAFVKSKHPLASPNSSFASQLRLFQKVGYITNTLALKRNPEFRDFAACNGHLFDRDPTGTYTLIESKNLSTIKYSCQKCRDALFFDFNVIRHTIEKEEGEENIYCNLQYLTTPMEWMNLQEFRGKINCPNCNLKLGNYIWGGRECESIVELGVTCGKFVQPWIQIQVNRVDNSVLNKTE